MNCAAAAAAADSAVVNAAAAAALKKREKKVRVCAGERKRERDYTHACSERGKPDVRQTRAREGERKSERKKERILCASCARERRNRMWPTLYFLSLSLSVAHDDCIA